MQYIKKRVKKNSYVTSFSPTTTTTSPEFQRLLDNDEEFNDIQEDDQELSSDKELFLSPTEFISDVFADSFSSPTGINANNNNSPPSLSNFSSSAPPKFSKPVFTHAPPPAPTTSSLPSSSSSTTTSTSLPAKLATIQRSIPIKIKEKKKSKMLKSSSNCTSPNYYSCSDKSTPLADQFYFSSSALFSQFLLLPTEIQVSVLQFMYFKDVFSCSQTSKHVYSISHHNSLWKQLSISHLSISPQFASTFSRDIPQWFSYFKLQIQLRLRGKSQNLFTPSKITPLSASSPLCYSNSISSSSDSKIVKPKPRFAHSSAVINNKIYYLGGQTSSGRSSEILKFHHTKNVFSELTPASPQQLPAFARHQSVAIGDKIYTFGGYDYTNFYQLSVYDTSKNIFYYPQTFGDTPAARSNHSCAAIGNTIYIFGGSVGDDIEKYTVTNDFYSLDTLTLTWTKINIKPRKSTGNNNNNNNNNNEEKGYGDCRIEELEGGMPSERVGHVMITIGSFLYMYGGGIWSRSKGWGNLTNELLIFDPKVEKWFKLVPKKGSFWPGISTYPLVFSLGLNLYLYGGANLNGEIVGKEMKVWRVMEGKWEDAGDMGIGGRSIGTVNVVEVGKKKKGKKSGRKGEPGKEVIMWGGYCAGVVKEGEDLWRIKINLK